MSNKHIVLLVTTATAGLLIRTAEEYVKKYTYTLKDTRNACLQT